MNDINIFRLYECGNFINFGRVLTTNSAFQLFVSLRKTKKMAVNSCTIDGSNIEWIDVFDPAENELEHISKKFNLNSYTVHDSLDPDHLPKYEEHNDTHFIIIRLLREENGKLQTVQNLSTKIAIFYNDKFIVTIHRSEQPLINKIREKYISDGKISTTTGVVIKIIRDALTTFEQPALQLSNQIDEFESNLFLKKNIPENMIEGIYFLKTKVGLYKKLLLLSDEVVKAIRTHGEDRPAWQDTRDLHTKLMLLYDQIHDDANNLLNVFLSLSARKTNDVMKILTIFSVFFMPMTFIVGVYGMNFDFMPELHYKYGYPLTILAMLVTSVIILIWFKRKNWM